MGKVTGKVKLTNLFDSTKSVEVEALIGTGATMVREGLFEVLAESPGTQALVGQVVEVLDLVVDAKNRRLGPNPESPEMPMVDLL